MSIVNSDLLTGRLNVGSPVGVVDVQSKSRARFIAWFWLFITAGWLTSIWTYRFLPMHDYPTWIYAGRLFSQLIQKQAPSCYSIVPYPVPNTLFVGITGLLDLFLAPETSGKVFLSFSVVLFALGSYRLFGSITTRRDSPLFLLPLLYVFNRSVWVGEISYEFSLGILFLALAYVLAPRDRLRATDIWLIAGFSLLIFFSHAVSYLCWLIVLTLLTVFDSPRFPRFKTLLAISPSLLLMALYILHREKSGPGLAASSFTDVLKSKLEFVSIFSPLHFFDPFYWNDPKPLKLLATVFNFSVVMVVVTLVVIWVLSLRGRAQLAVVQNASPRAVAAAPLVFFAVFFVAPFSAVTRVYDFNGRFLLPAFIVMLASLASNRPRRLLEGTRWALTLAAAAAAITVLAFQFFYVGRVAHELQGVYGVLSQADLSSDFRDVVDNEFEHLDRLVPSGSSSPRLLPVHGTLAYFVQYLRLERPTCVPLFPTTTSIIKTSVAYHPLLSESKTMTQSPGSVVILGPQTRNRVIADLMVDQYETIADTEYVLILRRKAELAKLPTPGRTP
jgi:hypothetical protein